MEQIKSFHWFNNLNKKERFSRHKLNNQEIFQQENVPRVGNTTKHALLQHSPKLQNGNSNFSNCNKKSKDRAKDAYYLSKFKNYYYKSKKNTSKYDPWTSKQ